MARLLIVDDEASILSALKRSLRREGWEIVTAESPQDALRVLDAQPVDLVLSDQMMPGMTGLELFDEVTKRQPGASKILITGWSEEVSPEALAAIGVKAMIAKPWDDAELKRVLHQVLDGAGD
jgi:adenylate cyclase